MAEIKVSDELNKFSNGILSTGFVLENRIAQILQKNSWNVISNKYYEDDYKDEVREIDLVAYKVRRVEDFDVYTSLIISCKQSQKNTWALLCRDINLKDPNSDFWPLHCWSNKASLEYQLSAQGCSKKYYEDMVGFGIKHILSDPMVDIFAFQEMDSDDGKAKNDKAIYSSITSLIKAQSYEMGALPERKKAASVYQFNLLSITDTEIIKLKFNGDKIEPLLTTSEHFISRYILKKKQSFSRIRFINSAVFETVLNDYNQLHSANAKWFNKLSTEFYDGIERDANRINVYLEEFKEILNSSLNFKFYKIFKKLPELKHLSLDWDDTKQSLAIDFFDSEVDDDVLNGDDSIKDIVREALLKAYRYKGAFYFGTVIPF